MLMRKYQIFNYYYFKYLRIHNKIYFKFKANDFKLIKFSKKDNEDILYIALSLKIK